MTYKAWQGWDDDAWDGWELEGAVDTVVDGAGIRFLHRRRRPEKPPKLHPEEIARQQREDERYLASLEKPQLPAKDVIREEASDPTEQPAVEPFLADVAARAASAVHAKIEQASQAATEARLAEDKRRRKLALLLALD